MTEPALSPAVDLAERLGFDEPDARVLRALERAIADAEADVEAYLRRPITPVTRTVAGRYPMPWGWALADDEPVRRIISTTPETFTDPSTGVVADAGTFTVVYEVGLDYRTDRELAPIRRYVAAAALNSPELLVFLARTAGLRGPVQSVSVSTEGQSKNVTYKDLGYGGGGTAGADAPGALPARATLDRWRRRSVHQAPDQMWDPRTSPYGAGVVWGRDGFWNTTP